MGTLHEHWGRLFQDGTFTKQILARAVYRNLRRQGFHLDEAYIEKIREKLTSENLESVTFEFEDEQVPEALLVRAPSLGKENLALKLEGIENDIEEEAAILETAVESALSESIKKVSPLVLKTLHRQAPKLLRQWRRSSISFGKEVTKIWQSPLNLLELLIKVCQESGESHWEDIQASTETGNPYMAEVLTRLQARSCQVALEILALMQNGFADGAHARWRCLHELSVVCCFLAQEGEEVAEKYLLHDHIESYRAALQYNEHSVGLALEPLSEPELAEMLAIRDALIDRFGRSYGTPYGWASNEVQKSRPTFADIEKHVSLDYLRPYYKLASHNVHANPKGVFFKLGLLEDEEGMLLAGPSPLGLADPGQQTALSLTQITVVLLTSTPIVDQLLKADIVQTLGEEAAAEFLKTYSKLEANWDCMPRTR